jgi:hypothetical protein
VLALSGLKTGEPATDARLAAAQKALAESDRFDDVEVRKRFRSIDDPSDILVMIVVRERPGVTGDDLTPAPSNGCGRCSSGCRFSITRTATA